VRGFYDQHCEKVGPGTPDILPRCDDAPPNRLALARGSFPCGIRSRRASGESFWGDGFRTGIVKPRGDFGTQGEKPSHRECLDWLACELSRAWDMKHLVRLIVQWTLPPVLKGHAPLFERDPENDLLARGTSRLSAERMIRDKPWPRRSDRRQSARPPPVPTVSTYGIWGEGDRSADNLQQEDPRGKRFTRRCTLFGGRMGARPVFFDTAKRQTGACQPANGTTPPRATTSTT